MSFRDWDIFDEMARLRRELGHFAAAFAGASQPSRNGLRRWTSSSGTTRWCSWWICPA